MKIYEWQFAGRTGTLTASNTKECKELLVGILRDKGDKSTRIPKGTTIKKIGLSKDKPKSKSDPAIVAVDVAHTKHNVADDTWYDILTKNTTFTNCYVKFPDGNMVYVGESCEYVVQKGTKCVKIAFL